MKICSDDKSMEITIDSYEFPYHETSFFEDNNWLNVKAICEDEVLVEEGIDACLLTSELPELLKGFGRALVGEMYQSSFMEPTLYIELKPEAEMIQMKVSFHLPNRHVFEVRSNHTKLQLDAMIEEIKTWIQAYPVRKKQLFN